MIKLDRILVVVSQDQDSVPVLEKAAKIATQTGAKLFPIQVVFDASAESKRLTANDRQSLKTLIMQAAEEWLVDQVDAAAPGCAQQPLTLWHQHAFEAILDAARDVEANLILTPCTPPTGLDGVLWAPQDWHLLRHAEIPVMMVKESAWVDQPVILAAIDALHDDQAELNGRVLTEAAGLAQTLGGVMDIVVVHPFVQPMIGPNTVPIDFGKLREEAEEDITRVVDETAANHHVDYRYLHIEEGSTANGVGFRADESGAEILVMGTVAREGIRGLLLGNTSETILYRIKCDVAVIR